ncbi:hypothetical protein FACS189421_07660 [Bacteroidia bacterium]|nr:hypothetical protein FACS189421_07660 [Bacteroidia bacterium]GHT47184.1 hypothetical protein FACS189440_06970 [Bacteroidia bacterium]
MECCIKEQKNDKRQHLTSGLAEVAVQARRNRSVTLQVCLWHIPQIKHKLGISGVSTNYSSWRNTENAAQIDLVIDRNDHIINLCEMKYSKDEYTITKEYNDVLRKRYALFTDETKTRKTVHTTMITTLGVKHNMYRGNIQSEVILDNLFAI